MQEPGQGQEAKGWPAVLGLIFYAAGAALLAWGQSAILKGQMGLGLSRSLTGALLAFAGYFVRELPWRTWLATWMAARVQRSAAILEPRSQGRPLMPLKVLQTSEPEPNVPVGPWTPFALDTVELSRHWLWLPMGLLLLLVQWFLLRGSIAMASIQIVLFVLFLSVYLQDLTSPIHFRDLNQNARAFRSLIWGLPFQALGVWLLWGYKYVFTGWGFTTLGSYLMLRSLYKEPFSLSLHVGDVAAPDPAYYPPLPWFRPSRLFSKTGLVLAAAICGHLAMNVFAGSQPGLSLAFGLIGIVLIVASFPWFPMGLAGWEALPSSLRGFMAAIIAILSLNLALYGQRLIDLGSLNQGLWYLLAGGVLVALALHRGPAEKREDLPLDGTVRKMEIWGLLAFFVLVFALRAWKIDIFPWGAEGDEAGGGVFAWDALYGRVESPIVTSNVPLYYYSITSFFFKFFGLSVGVMRWHVVIFGTASVIALYFLLRLFYGRWIAFFGTCLMAMSHWHLHYSRFGHYNAEQLFFQTVAFYYIFKSFRTDRMIHWILGGAAFGFAILPNLASRVLPFIGIALILYFLVARRDMLRRHLPGFVAFMISAWMVASPCLVYWARVIPLSMGRAKSVSIFDKTNTNAPVDTLSGFVANCKVNMLMFNHIGDTRSRNNPLPNEKMLETMTAALFALAFLYALYHWRDSFMFVLIAGFFINLSTSIFSVEAPQSHRTAGNIPIIFSMIAFLFYDARRAFELAVPRKGRTAFLLLAIPLVGVMSWRAAERYFVGARNLTFDVAPTYVAMKAGQVGKPEDQGIFWATGFASGHPPVLLFKKDVPLRNYYNITDSFPVSLESQRRHLMFLVDDYQDYLPYVKSLYPQAKVEAIPNLQPGRDIAAFIDLSPAMLASVQGLEVKERSGTRTLPAVEMAWPIQGLEGAKDLRYQGSLRFHYFGFYTFKVAGQGDCKLVLNGQTAFTRYGGAEHSVEMRLPRGLSAVVLDYSPRGAGDSFKVHFEGRPHPLRQFYSLQARDANDVTRNMTFHLKPRGLYGRYYTNREYKEDSAMDYLEPSLLTHWLDSPFPGGWSAIWKARLKVPETGRYRIDLKTNGAYSQIKIDGHLVSRMGPPPVAEMVPPRFDPQPLLIKGEHDLEIRFSTAGQSWMDLRWVRPGKTSEELVLPEYLTPVYSER